MKEERFGIYVSILIFGIFIWELIGKNSPSVRILISTPSQVGRYIKNSYINLLSATFTTFSEAFLGLVIATAFCFFIMIICLYIPKLLNYILPFIITSQIIPLITLAPLFIIIFGAGISSKIAMATLMCFFPIFVNFGSGIKIISKDVLDFLQIYDASISFKIFKVFFPLSLPSIFAGLKISATLAVIGAIVAEFNGADIGLGKNLFLAAKRLEPELMMSSLIFASVLGGVMFFIVHLIELRVGKWYLSN